MPYTMADFRRDYFAERFAELSQEEQQEALSKIPLETRLAGLTEEQIRAYLDRRSAQKPAAGRKPRRKK